MKSALLIAPGEYPGCESLHSEQAAEWHWVGDRSWLQRVVEWLVEGGVGQIEFVLCQGARAIEEYFGNGERWGCQFSYRLCQDPSQPYRALRARRDWPEWLWVVHSQWLSQSPLPDLQEGQPRLLMTAENWAGAAWMPGEKTLELVDLPVNQVGVHLLSQGWSQEVLEADCLDGPEALLQANQKFLGEACWSRAGREVDPGIWLGRDVVLHPTAQLIAPVYISPHCRIEAGCRVGPGVVLADHVVVDRRTHLRDCLVSSGSYLGPGLEIQESLVDPRRIFMASSGFALYINDPLLLSSTRPTHELTRGLLSRLVAMLLLIFAGLGRPSQNLRRVVQQPSSPDSSQWLERTEVEWRSLTTLWQHFREVFLPGLRRASRGEVRLVGVRPRSARELADLSREHSHQVIGLPHGLVDEALVEFGLAPTPQQQSLADAHYSATRSARREFRLLCRYFLRVLAEVAGAPQV